MDEMKRKRFEETLSSFEEDLMESEMDSATKNAFLKSVSIMKEMHTDTQMAHLRIDHRKDELACMRKSIEEMASKIGDMAEKINGLVKLFNSNIRFQREQSEAMNRNWKRLAAYVTVASVISLIGTFGSLKGASISSAIWTTLGKLL